MKAFKKQLNNMIIEWENLYGEYYNLMYDERGKLRKFEWEVELDQIAQNLHVTRTVMGVLKKLKRISQLMILMLL